MPDITPHQRRTLYEALVAAAGSVATLERIVGLSDTGFKFAEIVRADANLRDAAFALIAAAEAAGWPTLRALFASACREVNSPALRSAAAFLEQGSAAVGHERLSSTMFDLADVEQEFWNVMAPSPDAMKRKRLLAFGLRRGDEPFLTKLLERFELYLGREQTQSAWRRQLSPTKFPPDKVVDAFAKYMTSLPAKNKLCVFHADEAEEAAVDAFWQRARERVPPVLDAFIVALIVKADVSRFPDGVEPLPNPKFTYGHVREWTEAALSHIGWEEPRAKWVNVWSKRIYDEAADGDTLDIQSVYQVLDDHLKLILYNRDEFRDLLEERE